MVDPPGEVLWLAAGRPPLLFERLLEATTGRDGSMPVTRGDPTTRSTSAVPRAVAAARAALGAGDETVDARLSLMLGPVDLGRLASGLHLGDSHGLAIAVAVLRDDGGVDLGTAVVAATGRIADDGSVLPVGGLGPKVRAARRSGAAMVLVPAGQVDVASRTAGPDLTVVGVQHLREVLDLTTGDLPVATTPSGTPSGG